MLRAYRRDLFLARVRWALVAAAGVELLVAVGAPDLAEGARAAGTEAVEAAIKHCLLAFQHRAEHAADDAAQLQQGKVLFGQGAVPACALCHALKDAGAEGAVGPSLDELKPDAKRVATALRNGIGQMPSYNGKLSDAQIAALAAYVAKASGGSK